MEYQARKVKHKQKGKGEGEEDVCERELHSVEKTENTLISAVWSSKHSIYPLFKV